MSLSGSPPEFRPAGSGSPARARHILGTKLKYIDHPSFADPTAPDVIPAPFRESVDDGTVGAAEAPWPPASSLSRCPNPTSTSLMPKRVGTD
jgi:hypothetical protein